MNLFYNFEIFEGIAAACSHVKGFLKNEALWACAQVYHVCKTAEAATAMTRLERLETEKAPVVPMALASRRVNSGGNFII